MDKEKERRATWVPGAVIVGAGPSGLAAAACLAARGVPATVLERSDSLAFTWRHRMYDRLAPHLPKRFCELPLLPFPEEYPTYPNKDQFVTYMERYAAASGVAPRFGASVEEAAFEKSRGAWAVRLAGGEVLLTRWLVVATGENAEPRVPEFPGMRQFAGRVLHTCEYKSGEEFAGEKVLVVGCGNSGMEVSLDLCRHGAKPSMVVRNTEATVTNQGLHGFGKQVLEDLPSIEATITDPPEWIMSGLPKVQTQHGPYCVFYAIAYVVALRTGAMIDVPAYVDDYIMKLRKSGQYAKIKKGMTDLEVFQNEKGMGRVIKALEMLKNEGVMAEKNHVKLRAGISGYTCHERMTYDEVCDMLYYGDPILGTFDIGGNFNDGGIYQTILGSHMVMFVGYGSKNERPYLVFLNSYGSTWGINGLGRIYFDQVHQKEQYEAFRFITLQFRDEVDTHLAKFCPNLHVPTSEITYQSDEPAPPFEISDPSQAYGYGNSEIRLQESAARYNEIGKSSKAHQSMEEMKPSLLVGTMELEASKEELWRIEQSIAKLVPQVVAEQGGYSHPWYNELTKPSKAYQVSGTSQMHVIGKGFHGYMYPSSDIQDMIDSRAFTAETVIHNMSELCVGKDVRADKLENLERIGHGGSMKDDLKEIQENQWKLFRVSDFGKERALMDQIDPAQ